MKKNKSRERDREEGPEGAGVVFLSRVAGEVLLKGCHVVKM